MKTAQNLQRLVEVDASTPVEDARTMRRGTTVAALATCAAIAVAWPAEATTPLGQVKRDVQTMKRQIRLIVAQGLQHDQIQTSTVTAPVTWVVGGDYGTAAATCPPDTTVTGGGVQWSGNFGHDSSVYYSQPIGQIGWKVGLRGGDGTTGTAYVVAVCAKLG